MYVCTEQSLMKAGEMAEIYEYTRLVSMAFNTCSTSTDPPYRNMNYEKFS